jgi:transmembrane sensor
MKKDKFLALLSKKLSEEISDAENEVLAKEIESNQQYKQTADRLVKYFRRSKTKKSKTDQLRNTWAMIVKAEQEGFQGTFDYNEPKKTNFRSNSLLKIAAIFILGILSMILWDQFYKHPSLQENENYTTNSQKSFKLLEDGTKVWLNENSSITFNNAFGKQKREITLQGEAYFDVVKNTEVPLFIHVNNIDIVVKGTAFNVNAYRENSTIEVALARGLIEVSNRLDQTEKVLLKPNEKLIIPYNIKNGHLGKFKVIQIPPLVLFKETKWTSDTLIFKKQKLKDLAIQMERKYALTIEIQSEKLSEKRFSGVFTDETIEQALEALKLSYPLTYVIKNRLVIIKD